MADDATPKMKPGHNGIIFSVGLQKICYPTILSSTYQFFQEQGQNTCIWREKEWEFYQKNLINGPSNDYNSDSESAM